MIFLTILPLWAVVAFGLWKSLKSARTSLWSFFNITIASVDIRSPGGWSWCRDAIRAGQRARDGELPRARCRPPGAAAPAATEDAGRARASAAHPIRPTTGTTRPAGPGWTATVMPRARGMARGMVRAGLRNLLVRGWRCGVAGEGEEQEAGGLLHPSRRRRGVGRAERWPGARPGTRPGRGHQLCPVEPEVGADEEALQYATTAATSNPSPSRSRPGPSALRAVRAQGRRPLRASRA